jgi:hypothetical protein
LAEDGAALFFTSSSIIVITNGLVGESFVAMALGASTKLILLVPKVDNQM